MKPAIPDLLSAICAIGDRTLDRPTGDPRRLDEINRLLEQAQIAIAGSTLLVNEWTLLFLRMLRKLEQAGPLGEPEEIARAQAIGLGLQSFISKDCLAAHFAVANVRAETTDQDYTSGRTS